jgi:hypothetical protein
MTLTARLAAALAAFRNRGAPPVLPARPALPALPALPAAATGSALVAQREALSARLQAAQADVAAARAALDGLNATPKP